MKVLVLNGPNLNMLGLREPELYGKGTYADLETFVSETASRLGIEVEMRQTNHEGTLVDWIQQSRGVFDAIVLNAAAYTHTSVAVLDALKAVKARCVEVHLTDPKTREEFRHVSYVGMVAEKTFAGLGFGSYSAALEYLAG
ncbi:MAG: type II 3-dehydroquinate dehydratase [Lentisphaerae bacterium]|jgi:3-dehydroquinate dehydratase-2|nr:type II 3-dehydroquinate dehydratase [Lentisphaerota bacterium]